MKIPFSEVDAMFMKRMFRTSPQKRPLWRLSGNASLHPYGCRGHAWIWRHVNGFGLSPPYIGKQLAVNNHVGEYHILHSTLVSVLNADSAIRLRDNAVVEKHSRYAIPYSPNLS